MSEMQSHGGTIHQFTLRRGTRIELAVGFSGIEIFPDNGSSRFITETELRELAFGGLVVSSHRVQDMQDLLAEQDMREPGCNAAHWLFK